LQEPWFWRITTKIKQIVEEKMRQDNETTAMQLHTLLAGMGYNLSKKTNLCSHGMDVYRECILPTYP